MMITPARRSRRTAVVEANVITTSIELQARAAVNSDDEREVKPAEAKTGRFLWGTLCRSGGRGPLSWG
jgi:hypothetical protein